MKHQLFAAAAAALTLAGCGPQEESETQANAPAAEAARTYSGTGKVTAISGDQVTIAHGPIEAIGWPAMTMSFRAGSPEMAQGVSVGDRIFFAFRQDGGAYTLTSLKKAG